MKLVKYTLVSITSILILLMSTFLYFNRGLPQAIHAAEFTCLSSEQGQFTQDNVPFNTIYGVGLSYAHHINETASDFSFNEPPIFIKSKISLLKGSGDVFIPKAAQMLTALNDLDAEAVHILNEEAIQIKPLLDHEAELAFVLLEDVSSEDIRSAEFIPKIGFLIVNDLSDRSLAILGEGQDNRYEYWGISKSFPGFLPVANSIWIPNTPHKHSNPCVTLQTYVDGELRQSENSRNLIYTPEDILKFVLAKYQSVSLKKGDVFLTGTPGGVIFNVPRWKVRLASLISMDRFQKLAINLKDNHVNQFLTKGNQVKVSGEWLGSVDVVIGE